MVDWRWWHYCGIVRCHHQGRDLTFVVLVVSFCCISPVSLVLCCDCLFGFYKLTSIVHRTNNFLVSGLFFVSSVVVVWFWDSWQVMVTETGRVLQILLHLWISVFCTIIAHSVDALIVGWFHLWAFPCIRQKTLVLNEWKSVLLNLRLFKLLLDFLFKLNQFLFNFGVDVPWFFEWPAC